MYQNKKFKDHIKPIFQSLKKPFSFELEQTSHRDFLLALYSMGREFEMQFAPMDEKEKRAFLLSQFNLRHSDYQKNYPDAHFLIIKKKQKPIGRLVFNLSDSVHIIDISIIKKEQNKGLGSTILNDLIDYANLNAQTTALSVAMDNVRAFKLYQKLGFVVKSQEGFYYRLEKER